LFPPGTGTKHPVSGGALSYREKGYTMELRYKLLTFTFNLLFHVSPTHKTASHFSKLNIVKTKLLKNKQRGIRKMFLYNT